MITVWLSLLVSLFLACLVVIFFYRRNRFNRGPEPSITYALSLPAGDALNKSPSHVYKVINELILHASKGLKKTNRPSFSLEIVASRSEGIQFLVSVPLSLGYTVRNYLIAYWPKLTISRYESSDELLYKTAGQRLHARLWQLKGHSIETPIDYLMATMRGLRTNEVIMYQLTVRPKRTSVLIAVVSIAGRIGLVVLRFFGIVGYFMLASSPALEQYRSRKLVNIKKRRPAGECLVSIRTSVISPSDKRLKLLDSSVSAALKGSGLRTVANSKKINNDLLERRLDRPSRLNYAGLAQLYYLPVINESSHEEISLSPATRLPQSQASSSQAKPEIILGLNDYNANKSLIGLTKDERRRHLLILGATGMGKSTLLAYAMAQDLSAKRGMTLIDPHGDLAEQIMGLVPKQRKKDVIYINPADIAHPIGINLMQLPPGLSGDELVIAKDFVTEAIVSIFRKIFSDDDSGGHRIEYILRNAVHTAFYVPDATLFTIHKLLVNDTFRAQVVARLEDDSLKDFWYGEFNKAGSYQRVKMISGVTAKLGRFQRSAVSAKIIGQVDSGLNFDDLINNKKVLICNFSKGSIGEDTATLLGMIVIAKLQLAAWHRAGTEVAKRNLHYVYIDEFQSFASQTLSQMVSESRKYGLSLTIAEQTTANQNTKDVNILLANIAHIVAFRLAAPLDVGRILPLFGQEVSKTDLVNLEPFNFYCRIFSDRSNRTISGKTILIQNHKDKILK